MGLPVLRTAAQLLPRNSKLRVAAEVVGAVADAAQEDAAAVTLQGVEDIVYLDDSGSMMGSRLTMAQDLWRELAARLQVNPARIVKFGSSKMVLQPRISGFSANAVAFAWNAQSGETYMWHMILDDLLSCYKPGPGRMRVFIVTDGGDNRSPPPYAGMGGMDPMMKELLDHGFNVEFHIVFVSAASATLAKSLLGIVGRGFGDKDLRRYHDLALATGGSFLHISGEEADADREAFVSRISSNCEVKQEGARREYERRLSAGDATQFPWYERLPPPSR